MPKIAGAMATGFTNVVNTQKDYSSINTWLNSIFGQVLLDINGKYNSLKNRSSSLEIFRKIARECTSYESILKKVINNSLYLSHGKIGIRGTDYLYSYHVLSKLNNPNINTFIANSY
jgi:hypothetical protein